MLKKFHKKNHQEIKGLASQCELLEKQIQTSIHEILKLVDSINSDLEEEFMQEAEISSSNEVSNNEEQTSST